jgi:hypothetical protein
MPLTVANFIRDAIKTIKVKELTSIELPYEVIKVVVHEIPVDNYVAIKMG